ncbi:MAG: hypothetical protein HBSIN02_25480 [Bacteroidia bacterium]|nr:MAG: hypothetical protein HBSIN02_25480 [Bacteroidia bacterium]
MLLALLNVITKVTLSTVLTMMDALLVTGSATIDLNAYTE